MIINHHIRVTIKILTDTDSQKKFKILFRTGVCIFKLLITICTTIGIHL